MLVEIWSNGNSYSLLEGMQNAPAILEATWAVSYKTKHILTLQSSNHAPWHLLKGAENLCPHTCAQMFIAALFIIPKFGSNQYTLQYMNIYPSIGEWIKCGISRQWNIFQH